MDDPVPSQPADMRDLAAQLRASRSPGRSALLAKRDRVLVIDRGIPLVEQAHPAGIHGPGLDLERFKKSLELMVFFYHPHIRLAEMGDEFL